MNKGLFYHLMITIGCILSWLFILGDTECTIKARAFVIAMIFLTNFFSFIVIMNTSSDVYNEKIKLW